MVASKTFVAVAVLVTILASLVVPNHGFAGGGCRKARRNFDKVSTSGEKRAFNVLRKKWFVYVCDPPGKRSIEKVRL